MINLPLKKISQNKKINELSILKGEDYNKKILKKIEYAYKQAPYFNVVYNLIEDIICYKEGNLADYLSYSIHKICTYLNITTKISKSSDIQKNNTYQGQERIIELCKKLSASTYTNPIGGKALYSNELFSLNNIELCFFEPKLVEYKQYNNAFIPALSIIDILMFNSVEKIREMLTIS